MKFKETALVTVFAAAATLGLAGCDNHKTASAPKQQTAVTQTAPAQQAPVATQPAAPVHKGDTDAEKQAKIDRMEKTDIARLTAMGYKVTADIGKGTANQDFTDLIDGKWHGNSTTFEYSIRTVDGSPAKILVEHHNFVPTIHNPIKLQ